ncbi:MAG: ISAs1 family transposase [Dysgonamonadaceae bacterium]|nr:ISAs1 family transposase [Dysgonamonadaceae bacterium]
METRRCQVFEKGLIVDSEGRWAGLQSVIKITATREVREKITTEDRYCISSLSTNSSFNQYIRNHWGVENSLHWTLDMVFREDGQRSVTGRLPKILPLSGKSPSIC